MPSSSSRPSGQKVKLTKQTHGLLFISKGFDFITLCGVLHPDNLGSAVPMKESQGETSAVKVEIQHSNRGQGALRLPPIGPVHCGGRSQTPGAASVIHTPVPLNDLRVYWVQT